MKEQERWQRELAALRFAQWELHIFLDTHPDYCNAGKRLAEINQKLQALTEQYEEKYGPVQEHSSSQNRWAWISGPWPWEEEAN